MVDNDAACSSTDATMVASKTGKIPRIAVESSGRGSVCNYRHRKNRPDLFAGNRVSVSPPAWIVGELRDQDCVARAQRDEAGSVVERILLLVQALGQSAAAGNGGGPAVTFHRYGAVHWDVLVEQRSGNGTQTEQETCESRALKKQSLQLFTVRDVAVGGHAASILYKRQSDYPD